MSEMQEALPSQEIRQPNPAEQVEQMAAQVLEMEQAYIEAIANQVVDHLNTGPQRAANLIFKKVEAKGDHSLALVRFRLGQPVEFQEQHLLDLITFTTWVGGAVRIAILAFAIVVIAGFINAWMLPQQPVQIQQSQGK